MPMVAYYAHPYSRKPFWREREDDGRHCIHVVAPRTATSTPSDGSLVSPPLKHLERHWFSFRRGGKAAAIVYMADDDGAAHWQLFLLVATVAIVTIIKTFVEHEEAA
jgi:hypothetical protein